MRLSLGRFFSMNVVYFGEEAGELRAVWFA